MNTTKKFEIESSSFSRTGIYQTEFSKKARSFPKNKEIVSHFFLFFKIKNNHRLENGDNISIPP